MFTTYWHHTWVSLSAHQISGSSGKTFERYNGALLATTRGSCTYGTEDILAATAEL